LIIIILYFVIAIIKNEIIFKPILYEKKKYDWFIDKIGKMTNSSTSIREINYFYQENTSINVWYIINPIADKYIFIYPGNHGNITYRFGLIRFWYINYSVIIFDYPGFGKSYSSNPNISVPQELFTYCTDIFKLNINDGILLGENIGCYWALKEVINLQNKNLYPSSLIMHTPIYSERTYLSNQFKNAGLFYPYFLFKSGFNIEPLLLQLNGKISIFIAHSDEDKNIPISDSEKIVEKGKGIKLIKVKGKNNEMVVNHDYIYSLLSN
jgi:hypothetical protein